MALELKTEIRINATTAQVWKVLIDFSSYPQWNPFIKSITGEIEEGKKFKAVIDTMKFQPRVLSFKKNEHFQWLGRLILPGIFDGCHEFTLKQVSEDEMLLEHSEKFRGLLVPIFKKKLLSKTKSAFEQMNEALKSRVETMV